MKDLILKKTYSMIIKNNNYSDLEKEKVEYGLEALYLTITKLFIIFILAFILNIVKETITLLIFFNIIRFFGFGVHAKNSLDCFLSSSILFIFIPNIFYNFEINNLIKLIISIVCILNIFIFAPSDSKERRFTNYKKYLFRKTMTILLAIIYIYLGFYLENILEEILLLSVIIQSIIVNPLTYKIMGIDYNYQFLGLNRNI